MEKIFEQGLLYDFYGELLTLHQRSVYEEAVYNDMSLGEIAQEKGISRQGVHDLIKRCDKILHDYESKLHLVQKFAGAREKISEIVALTEQSIGAARADGGCLEDEAEDGSIKAGSIKDGSIKDGNIKDGNIKAGSIKDGSIKDGNIKAGSIKDGNIKEAWDIAQEQIKMQRIRELSLELMKEW